MADKLKDIMDKHSASPKPSYEDLEKELAKTKESLTFANQAHLNIVNARGDHFYRLTRARGWEENRKDAVAFQARMASGRVRVVR